MQTIFFLTKLLREMRPGVLHDPETKRQSSEWVGETSPRPKKLKFRRSRIMNTLIIFFDSQGVLHNEFVPEGKTVNAEFYKRVMDRFLKCIQRVRPVAFCSRDFFLLHDNAHAYKTASVCQFFTSKKCYNPLSARVIMALLSLSFVFMFRMISDSKCVLCACGDLLFSCNMLTRSAVNFLHTSRSDGGRSVMAVSASRASVWCQSLGLLCVLYLGPFCNMDNLHIQETILHRQHYPIFLEPPTPTQARCHKVPI